MQKISPDTPAAPVRTRRSNVLGAAARAKIIDTAQTVLRRNGWQGFSMRRVADACRLSVGNLTYHFPSKADLAEAVMESVCARYAEKREMLRRSEAANADAWLHETITWLIEDAVSEETGGLFLELWVMAKHHDFGGQIVDRFYTTAAGWLAEIIGEHFPKAEPAAAERAAYYLLTLSEGATVLFSRPTNRRVVEQDLIEMAFVAVRRMLEA